MSETGLLRYLLSCGLLTVPILVWNVVLTSFLPPVLASKEFWRNIPPFVGYRGLPPRGIILMRWIGQDERSHSKPGAQCWSPIHLDQSF